MLAAQATDQPAIQDEDQVLAEALVAVRRAAACQSLPKYAADALSSAADLLDLFAPARALRAVPTDGGEG